MKRASRWYFGLMAGVDFSSDPPVAIMSPQEPPERVTSEACVSMCDANGAHLFYATSTNVFNRLGAIMPNGSGLVGHNSATQMAAVQDPANDNKYYLFTLGQLGDANGLHYSIIDMTLDGGLGDVQAAQKNTLMMPLVTEKITTVLHANGIDTWVLVHGMNSSTFYAYLVTSAGVSTVPVETVIGSIHTDAVGQMKFSPDGCKVALALNRLSIFEVFNFDNRTGTVSNGISFFDDLYLDAYGIEFSPDASKLYVATGNSRNIFQFDLTQSGLAGIEASRVLLGHYPITDPGPGAMQLGPHGKIYIVFSDLFWLAEINAPNAPGLLCDFVKEGISLGTTYRRGVAGLPSFPQHYFYDPQPTISGTDTVCAGASSVHYTIKGSTSSCATEPATWSLHGKGEITSFTHTEAVIHFSEEGGIDTLVVERLSTCGRTADTLLIHVLKYTTGLRDTIICSSAPVLLDASTDFTSYVWQDNSTQQTFSVSTPGTYWVRATSKEGCVVTDTSHVRGINAFTDPLGPDREKCSGVDLKLNAGSDYISYLWQDQSQDQYYTVVRAGQYWVHVVDACGNSYADTVTLSEVNMEVHLGADQQLCTGDTIVLQAGGNYPHYEWQDGSSMSYYNVIHPGLYWVKVSDSTGCYAYDSLRVSAGVNCCETVAIPNLFTPNGDGKNERFEIGCITNGGWMLEIYNRWGDLIYHRDDYKNDWTANNVADGVYYYWLKKGDSEHRGWVQIVR